MLIAAIIVGGLTVSLLADGQWVAAPFWAAVSLALYVQSRKPSAPKRHRKNRNRTEEAHDEVQEADRPAAPPYPYG